MATSRVPKWVGFRKGQACSEADATLKEGARARIEFEESLYLTPGLVIHVMLGKVLPALLRREIRQFVKQLLRLNVQPAISLCSHACASRNSRRTRWTEADRTVADSSAVMPPK